jgi:hypothetical protein
MGLAFHHHILTCQVWILDVGIDGIIDVIEEGFETGITIALGGLFGSVSDLGQKGKDLIWGDRIYFPVTKFTLELGKDKLIILYRIFFRIDAMILFILTNSAGHRRMKLSSELQRPYSGSFFDTGFTSSKEAQT